MKVVITKGEFNCAYARCCSGKKINSNEVAITTTLRKGNNRQTWHFHPDCYTQFILQNKDEQVKMKEDILFRRKKKSDKPQGRPRKYTDMIMARNIKAKIFNHKKLGHTEVVEELNKQLNDLLIRKWLLNLHSLRLYKVRILLYTFLYILHLKSMIQWNNINLKRRGR